MQGERRAVQFLSMGKVNRVNTKRDETVAVRDKRRRAERESLSQTLWRRYALILSMLYD